MEAADAATEGVVNRLLEAPPAQQIRQVNYSALKGGGTGVLPNIGVLPPQLAGGLAPLMPPGALPPPHPATWGAYPPAVGAYPLMPPAALYATAHGAALGGMPAQLTPPRPALGGAGALGGAQTKTEMSVGDKMVAGLIGRGGSIIKDLIARSGAMIKISQKDDPNNEYGERTATITGTQPQVCGVLMSVIMVVITAVITVVIAAIISSLITPTLITTLITTPITIPITTHSTTHITTPITTHITTHVTTHINTHITTHITIHITTWIRWRALRRSLRSACEPSRRNTLGG